MMLFITVLVMMLFVTMLIMMLFITMLVMMLFVTMLIMMLFITVLVMMLFITVLVMMLFITMLIKSQWCNTGGSDQCLTVKVRGLNQTRQPGFKIQTINNQKIGLAERPGVGWRRGINMRVLVGTDQRCDINHVTAHLLDHVTQNRETRDNLQRIFVLCMGCNG